MASHSAHIALVSARIRTSFLGAALGAALAMSPRAAHADDNSAQETAAARALAVDGLKLAQAGKCTEAIGKLERAEKLYHSPIVLGRLGECYVQEGRLVEGTEALRRVLREPLPPTPPASLVKAYERAQTALDAAKPRIAGVTVSLSSGTVADLSLKLDGRQFDATLLDTEIPVDPGEHTIEASAPGYLKVSSRLTLAAADKKLVTLKLERDPFATATTPDTTAAPAPAPAASPAPVAPPPVAESHASSESNGPVREPSHTAAYVAWGVGVVGLGVGATFGVMTMKDKQSLDDVCTSDVCPSDRQDDIDAAKRSGLISTVAFGVGAAGIALGTVLYFAAGDGDEGTAAAARPRMSFAGLERPRAAIGLGGVRFAADF